MTKKGYNVALFTVIISLLLLFVPMAGAETIVARAEGEGQPADGEVLIVGGLDDSNSYPLDPYQAGVYGPFYDDEWYNLIPFVSDGDTSIMVYTLNPPDDDDVFFSALRARARARNLIPFVSDGDTSMTVYSFNPPSVDNNIFFAEVSIGSPQAGVRPSFVVPEFPLGSLAGLLAFLCAHIFYTHTRSRFLS